MKMHATPGAAAQSQGVTQRQRGQERLGTKPRGAMVAAVARSGETVGIGLARRQRLPRLVGHDGVTEDDVEPRITSGR